MVQEKSLRHYRFILFISCFLSAFWTIAKASTLPKVIGHLDAKDTLVFEGNSTYTKDQICKALYSDKDIIVALSPQAPLEGYLKVLESKIALGYLNTGFYSPHVAVSYVDEPEHILVMIEEGPRYTKGALVIEGASDALKEELTLCLNEMDPRVADASGATDVMEAIEKGDLNAALTKDVYMAFLWGSGSSPSFAPSFTKISKQYLERLLKVLGYYNAEFTLELVPDHTERTAALHIHFQNEGLRPQIAAINIQGNVINSNEQVLDYLGVKTGQHIDDIMIGSLKKKLYDSGRFRFIEVDPAINTDEPLRSTLNITLQETPSATPLGQTLTEKEALMQKFGQFIDRHRSWEKEICFRVDLQELEPMAEFLRDHNITISAIDVVYSSQKGIILSEMMNNTQVLNAVVISPEDVWYLCPPLGQDIRGTNFKGKGTVYFSIIPDASKENGWSIFMGMGLESGRSCDTFAYQPTINIHPAYWFYLANDPENEVIFVSETQALVRSKGAEIDVDRQTGELIEIRTKEKTPITLRKGAYESYIQYLKSNSGQTDGTPPAAPLELTMLNFMLPLYLTHLPGDRFTIEQKREAIKAWNQLFSGFAVCKKPQDTTLPVMQKSFPLPFNEQLASGGMMPVLMGFIYQGCHDKLPRDSWVRTLSHACVLLTSGYGQSGAFTQDLQQLYNSDQIGPVGYLLIAQVFQKLGYPAYNAFSQRGRQVLSAADFRKDWKPLLTGDYELKDEICCYLEKFRTSPLEDIETVGSVMSPEVAALLVSLAQRLKEADMEHIDTSLDPVLSEHWEKSLKEQTRQKLNEL